MRSPLLTAFIALAFAGTAPAAGPSGLKGRVVAGVDSLIGLSLARGHGGFDGPYRAAFDTPSTAE